MPSLDEVTSFLWDHVLHGTFGIVQGDHADLWLTCNECPDASVQLGRDPVAARAGGAR